MDNILLRDPATGGDATSLDAIVIIRDPEAVDSTFEETVEVATVDDFAGLLDAMGAEGVLPPDVTFDGAQSLETADVASIAPEDLQADYASFLEEYGHNYRASALIENGQCNSDFFFSMLSYSVDAFENAEDASNALTDDFLPAYYETIGYIAIDTGDATYNAYRMDAEICGEDEVAVTVDIQRGRYIANISVVYSAATVAQVGTDALLAEITASNIAQLFEAGLGSAYRSELR